MPTSLIGLHHDHIDGSAGVADIIHDLYALAEKEFPFPSTEAWLSFFRNPREDIVKKFGTVTGVLQTKEALRMLGHAYGAHRANEGFMYVEARFAPQYHVFGGLSLAAATSAMIDGLMMAQSEFGIRILPMLCIGRETDPQTGVDIARIALEYDGEVALDLACDEAAHPPEKHLAAFKLTKGTNVRRDCHAGEWVHIDPKDTYRARLLANVRTAIEVLEVDGIGHGIPLPDDPELVKMIVDRGIRVSGCPTSNAYCGFIRNVTDLRLDELLDAGVIYTLNPDDDLFMASTAEMVEKCRTAYGLTDSQIEQLNDNVIRGAFARDIAQYVHGKTT